MTQSPDELLSLAVKINRLFDAYRSRGEPEQTTADVASAVSRLIGRLVCSHDIDALRVGTDPGSPELVAGLSRHFGVPSEYLTTTDDRADQLDRQLRLLVAVRDAGVEQLALRGSTPELQTLAEALEACQTLSFEHEQ